MHRRTRHLLLALAAVAVAAFLAAGCGGSTSGSTSPSQAATAAPVKGGTLVATYQGEPQGLDPAIDWEGQGWAIEHTMFNNFIKYASKPGAAGTEMLPDLATEVPSQDNGGISRRRQDLHLPPQGGHQVRPAGGPGGHVRRLQVQLRAHDGRPQGAGDRLLRRRRRRPGVHGRQGQGDRGLHDAGQVHGRHQARQAGHGVHGRHGHVVHRRGRQGVGREVGPADQPAPAGHRPVHVRPLDGRAGDLVTRNPNYYAPETVYLDGIDFEFSLNPSTALLKLQRGDVNVLGDYIPPAEYVRVKADPATKGWSSRSRSSPSTTCS